MGAGGAVGTAAIQRARIGGAQVDAVSGAAGLSTCTELGASETFDYRDERATAALQRSGRYDVVVLASGDGDTWLGALRAGGRMALTRPEPPTGWAGRLPDILGRGLRVRPVTAGSDGRDLSLLARMVAAGGLRPVVGARYTVDGLAQAHTDLAGSGGGIRGARLILHRRRAAGVCGH